MKTTSELKATAVNLLNSEWNLADLGCHLVVRLSKVGMNWALCSGPFFARFVFCTKNKILGLYILTINMLHVKSHLVDLLNSVIERADRYVFVSPASTRMTWGTWTSQSKCTWTMSPQCWMLTSPPLGKSLFLPVLTRPFVSSLRMEATAGQTSPSSSLFYRFSVMVFLLHSCYIYCIT